MIPDVAGAAAAIVTRLAAAGVRASIDERDLNPPCVWVAPPSITWRFGQATWTADWLLTAVVPDTGRATSTQALAVLLDEVQAAMGWAAVTARPVSLTVPGAGPPLPGYEMGFSQRIRETTG